jgi:hypothetical protein
MNGRVDVTREHETIVSGKSKNASAILEVPYFFNATYFLMEIKGLVMYPKG